MQDFHVLGEYTEGKIHGEFFGALRIHDDDRVVGTMNGSGNDIVYNRGKTNLVLGLREGEGLNFWKFSPSPIAAPLVYATKLQNRLGIKDNGDLEYSGHWAPMKTAMEAIVLGDDDKLGLPEIREAFGTTSLERALDILSRIEKSRVQAYLDPTLINKVYQLRRDTGYLTLKPVRSLAA